MAEEPTIHPNPVWATQRNVYETAIATRKQAQQAEIANQHAQELSENMGHMVALQKATLLTTTIIAEQQMTTNSLLGYCVDEAVKTNEALANIDEHLLSLQQEAQTQTNELQKQTGELQKQTGVLAQNLVIQMKTYEMHKAHLDRFSRDKDLKQVLYDLGKQSKALELSHEPVARAFSSTMLLGVVDRNGFGTKDLYDIPDKELFDSLVERLTQMAKGISEDEGKLLAEYMKAYSLRSELLGLDPAGETKDLRGEPVLDTSDLDQLTPPPLTINGLLATEELVKELRPLLATLRHHSMWTRVWVRTAQIAGYIQGGMLAVFTCLALAGAMSWAVPVIQLLLFLACYGLSRWDLPSRKILTALGAPYLDPDGVAGYIRQTWGVTNIREAEAAVQGWDAYDHARQQSDELKARRLKKLTDVYEKEVADVTQFNAERVAQWKESKEKHKLVLAALKKVINDFLNRYPECQAYHSLVE